MEEIKIKSKIWLENKEGILISEGRVQLLKFVQQTGSLNKAAKEMSISYQKAWKLLDTKPASPNFRLIETKIGGSKGGGTIVTPYGKLLLDTYEAINKECWEFLDNQLKKHKL